MKADFRTSRKRVRYSHGHAMIIALALVLCLLIGVIATVGLIAQEAKVSKTERDYERALQMAEAGANAYVNMLTRGPAPNTVTNYQLIPASFTPLAADLASWTNGVMPISTFKAEIQNTASTKVPHANIVYYPIGQTRQCYFVYQTAALSATNGGDIVAFGWSNGVVRRVKLTGSVRGLFDFPALYGLSPGTAIDAKNIDVNGAWGAEGTLNLNGSTAASGPTLLAGAGIAANPNTSNLPGPILYSSRSLGIPTADQAANEWANSNYGATTTLGVEYFRTHNNNGTGLKFLVKSKTGTYREVSPGTLWNPSPTTGVALSFDTSVTPSGLNSGDTVVGIRAYPGDYYFTDINHNGVTIYGRNYADGSQPTSDPIKAFLTPDPSNPNTGASARTDARFWIGNTTSATTTSLHSDIIMEDTRYPTRFRIYDANKGGVTTKQANLSMSILVYNTDSSGAGYGSIDVQTQSVITGSVIAWSVADHGNSTSFNQGSADPANSDAFLFSTTYWREIQ